MAFRILFGIGIALFSFRLLEILFKLSRNMQHNEDTEQKKFFNWAAALNYKHPELNLMFSIPNEGYAGKNKQHAVIVGHRRKMMGRKPGVPDIFLPVPRGTFHGLFIEMKWGKNRPSPHQKTYIENLNEQGYMVEVCYSSEQAENLTLSYLNLEQ